MEETVIKSPNDKKQYKVISLSNGLTALLISDLDDDAQPVSVSASDSTAVEDSGNDTDNASEIFENASAGSEDEGNEDTEIDQNVPKKKVKMAAAALCINVGSFSDPEELPGLAHFLEHMVFMGSKKYPDENMYDAFISKHGGSNNAFTDCERTVFNMEVTPQHFKEALDIFANCFVSPLLTVDSMDREIEAVDSEFQLNMPSDTQRRMILFGSFAKKGHPMTKFMWGNTKSLKEMPLLRNLDVNECLQHFYKRYYSAHYMTLAVQSTETIETLENWVTEIFSAIPNNKLPVETFKKLSDPFKTEKFNKFYKVIPVKKTHQLVISWALPPMKDHYRVKPLDYLGWLVGHEGVGSILSYLKKKSWAVSLAAGNDGSGFEQNATYSLFSISIVLSEAGMDNILEVFKTVFQYLEMLRQAGPQKRIYEELASIKNMAFRFKDENESVHYVEQLAEDMQSFPPKHYLSGNCLFFEYDEKIIKSCQDELTIDKANIVVLSSRFTDDSICTEIEPWTQSKYGCSDIPQEWIEAAKIDGVLNLELQLPLPNKYIAENLDLKHHGESTSEFPVKIHDDEYSRVWYRKDLKFKVPKAFIYLNLISPEWQKNPLNSTMTDLFCYLLHHGLSDDTYSALVAELSYSVEISHYGLMIKVHGFDDKLHVLLETIIDHIANFDVTDIVFNNIKKHLSEVYYNSFIKPNRLCKDLRLSIIHKVHSPVVSKRVALQSVTQSKLKSFIKQCFSNIYLESLIQGNILQEEALLINKMIQEKLKLQPLPKSSFPEHRTNVIPEGRVFCRVLSFNKEDPNSSVCNYYQLGPENIESSCMIQLFMNIMLEPCFDTLRTQEQLGYDVSCFPKINFGVIGFFVSVSASSKKFRCSYVDERIEAFLDKFEADFDKLDDEKFTAQLQSLIKCKKCEDLDLKDEVERNWMQVLNHQYIFEKKFIEIEYLENLSLEKFKSWIKNNVLVNKEKRKKLGLQVVGLCENNEEVAGFEDFLNGLQNVDFAKNLDSESYVLRYIHDKPSNAAHSFITDIDKFKATLKCYPNNAFTG